MKLTRVHKTDLLEFFTASTDTSVEIPVFEGGVSAELGR